MDRLKGWFPVLAILLLVSIMTFPLFAVAFEWNITAADLISSFSTLLAGACAIAAALLTVNTMNKHNKVQIEEITKKNNIDVYFKYKEEFLDEFNNNLNHTKMNFNFIADKIKASSPLHRRLFIGKAEEGEARPNESEIDNIIKDIESIQNFILEIIEISDINKPENSDKIIQNIASIDSYYGIFLFRMGWDYAKARPEAENIPVIFRAPFSMARYEIPKYTIKNMEDISEFSLELTRHIITYCYKNDQNIAIGKRKKLEKNHTDINEKLKLDIESNLNMRISKSFEIHCDRSRKVSN